MSWAEELIELAQAADHRRLVQLCAMAAQSYAAGRVDEALRYIEVGRAALERDPMPTSRSASRQRLARRTT